uniref:Uncharacterized protein n=1 Tax=Physcomitrium patens TaxID=3218 RepID=A0A2K1KHC7_PHYPA|nr:hypothetical protein PHYPA_009559 [Physcomitrium patens]
MKITYAKVLKARLAHAPMAPTTSKASWRVELVRKGDRVEPKLIAATANLGKYAFNPIRAIPREHLREGLVRSCTYFLLNTQIVEVQLDEEKIRKAMNYLQKCVVIV